MKGVVLAGGLGTRLAPMTDATNKHTLPVFDRPMIYYPVQSLVKAGIKDILIVTGGPHAGDVMQVVKNGHALGVDNLYYAYQEGEGGIAAALALAKDFADGGNIFVILGDNCTDYDPSSTIEQFRGGAKIFLKEVPDPERFGVVEFAEKGDFDRVRPIKQIHEKPSSPPSNLAVTGLYLYDEQVFNKINVLEPSNRGELEITDINQSYLEWDDLEYVLMGDAFWSDAGTPESLYRTTQYWAQKAHKELS